MVPQTPQPEVADTNHSCEFRRQSRRPNHLEGLREQFLILGIDRPLVVLRLDSDNRGLPAEFLHVVYGGDG